MSQLTLDLDRSSVVLDGVLLYERSSQGHLEGQGHKSDIRAPAFSPSESVYLKNMKPFDNHLINIFSSGSSGQVEEGPKNMKFIRPPSVAIFL